MPNLRDLVRKAKVYSIAMGFGCFGIGFLLGVLAARWVG